MDDFHAQLCFSGRAQTRLLNIVRRSWHSAQADGNRPVEFSPYSGDWRLENLEHKQPPSFWPQRARETVEDFRTDTSSCPMFEHNGATTAAIRSQIPGSSYWRSRYQTHIISLTDYVWTKEGTVPAGWKIYGCTKRGGSRVAHGDAKMAICIKNWTQIFTGRP